MWLYYNRVKYALFFAASSEYYPMHKQLQVHTDTTKSEYKRTLDAGCYRTAGEREYRWGVGIRNGDVI